MVYCIMAHLKKNGASNLWYSVDTRTKKEVHPKKFLKPKLKKCLENRGIDPRTSRMQIERSTIWASSP